MKRLKKFLFLLLCAALAFSLLKWGSQKIKERIFPLYYEEYIEKYSKEYDLSKYFVMGVIRAESNFEYDAQSEIAIGLMQLTDDTAQWILGKLGYDYMEDVRYVPELNIKMGFFYLDYLKGIYENEETVLAAYNAGPGRVNSWLLNEAYSRDKKTLFHVPYEETEKYIKRVKIFAKIYEILY